jgi:uncharacterized membrane protein
MRADWRLELPQWLLIGAMFVAAAVSWSGAPDSIPVHWNAAGQVDRYGGKFEGLLLLPLLSLGIYLLLRFLPLVDPRRANYRQFGGTYAVLRLAVIVLMAAIYGLTLLWVRGVPVDISLAVPVLVGALFVLLGLLLPRVRPNWFVGIRTPWTLTSTRSWNATHRLGGYLFVAMGLALLLVGLARTSWAFTVMMVFVVGGSLALVAYSYLVWRDDPDRSTGNGR